MYNVIDVAKYTINQCHEKKYEISNLKLQKILYFIQAQFIAQKDRVCFLEKMECWEYGPVIPEVYSYYRDFGSSQIPYQTIGMTYNIKNHKFEEKKFKLNFKEREDQEIIDDIIDMTSMKSAFELVEITHHQKPWKEHYRPREKKEIPIKSMFEYFAIEE